MCNTFQCPTDLEQNFESRISAEKWREHNKIRRSEKTVKNITFSPNLGIKGRELLPTMNWQSKN
ncbi:MAG: hypothetical protein ABW118_17985, partial [Candidatus Thiodiazotropha sp.]